MNSSIIDPLQGDFPEVIEEFLEHGIMKCIAFNRRGTLLADMYILSFSLSHPHHTHEKDMYRHNDWLEITIKAGCSNGSCVIWDFETRGIAKELRDKDCVAAITSVCWSKYGHCILVSAADKTLILWDVLTGEKITQTTLEKTPLHARLHPGSSTPSLCLACPVYSAPLIVDLNTGTTTPLPASVLAGENGVSVPSRNKVSDDAAPQTPACFNKHGDLVYLGNSKGEILIIDHQNALVRAVLPITGGAAIKTILFSRNGQYLLTNSSDRIIRVYENKLSLKDGLKALDELEQGLDDLTGVEKLKAAGAKSLVLFREFQDSVTRIHWKAPCFSGDGEWVIGGSASKGEHKIYIWDQAGHLVKILEGPKEALIDLAWHPVHPIVVSVSLTGLVYIWAKDYTENWSAFAPDFKELEENEEYVEREDEFDIMPETEKVKELPVNQDDEVDILTVEHDSTFSDSDMSQEELCFLPAMPCPDSAEGQDKCIANAVKLENNHPDSPFSAEAGQNGQTMNHESSPIDGIENSMAEEANGGRLKRRRKPSEKVLEYEAEKVKKPLKKQKSCVKTMKPKSKSVVDEDDDVAVYDDDV